LLLSALHCRKRGTSAAALQLLLNTCVYTVVVLSGQELKGVVLFMAATASALG